MSKVVQRPTQETPELAVLTPVEGSEVAKVVASAEGGRMSVIDLPAVIALRSVVRPENEIPVGIDAVVGGRMAVERATRRPCGDLLAFGPRW